MTYPERASMRDRVARQPRGKRQSARSAAALVVVALAASVLAAPSSGFEIERYPGTGPTYFPAGISAVSHFDNCYYWNAYFTRNAMFKNDYRLGRAVFILTNGSWVNGVQDSNLQTNSYANGPSGNFTNNQKKGYITNTSSVAYYANGYLDGGSRSDCGSGV